ncbi:hypothetical protein [Desulforamulus reducens]|uniref:hypothetical protein n=1 Tax=Desulforamulus reducens TaxID=59610 RepID=UPI0009FC009F|nr:hypothetical protein [Desulforamulus reducens]
MWLAIIVHSFSLTVGMAEVTAVGLYIKFWFPDLPQWIPGIVAIIIIGAANLVSIKFYGEFKFWFGSSPMDAVGRHHSTCKLKTRGITPLVFSLLKVTSWLSITRGSIKYYFFRNCSV